MKRVLGIVLSTTLVLTSAFSVGNIVADKKAETKLKTYSISENELKNIADSKTGKEAAGKVSELKGNDYEAAVHSVLDKYYKNKDYKNIQKFEAKAGKKAQSILADYKAADKERKDEKSIKYEANTSILTFGADTEKSQIKAIVKDSYGKVDYIHKCTDGSYLVKVENIGLTAKKAANTYAGYVETNSSEINGKVTQIAEAWDMINDPYRYNEYYLSNLKVGDAWSYINGKAHSKVKVAIIDGGGIDINNNVDLTNVSNKSLSIVYNEDNSSYAMTGLNADFNTSNMHMINGAGLIGAQSNNGSQVAGVAAGTDNSIVDLVNVAIPLTVDKIAVGLDYASSVGCKVANLSLFHEGSYDYEEAAVNRFTNNGGTVVAGAGNNGADLNGFPSDYGNVISIIATNEDNSRRGTSNYGWDCDFCAPGTNITVAGPADQTWVTNGTSMASPIAAGVVAMMYSVNSGLNKTSVHNILKDTAQDLGGAGRDYEYAYGLINAGAAVAQAGGGSNQQTQPPTTTQAQTQAPTQAPTTKANIDPNTATYESVAGSTIYSYSVGSDATIVNVQNPGWSEGNYSGDGIYFHVPSGISSIKVNDGAGAHIEGAGGLVFLSALNDGINKIDVKYATGETTFYIKKAAVATTTAKQVVDGTELLLNTSFNGTDNWTAYTEQGAVFTANGDGSISAALAACSGGNTWSTQLKQNNLALDSSKYYVVSYVASSSVDKKIQTLIQTMDYATTDVADVVAIGAGQTKLVKKVFKPSKNANYLCGVMMGYVDGTASSAGTLKISDISLKAYNTESAANTAANNIPEPTTQAPTTTVAPTTTAQQTTKAETTTAQQTTKNETTAQQTTKAETTTAQQTTKAQTTVEPTTKKLDPSEINPEELTYKTYTVNHASLDYAKVKSVTGLVDPVFDNESTFSLLYSGAIGSPTSIKVNGVEQQASATGLVKEVLVGTLRINPTKLTTEYSVFDITFENGEEFVFAVKKDMTVVTTTQAGGGQTGGGDQPGETTTKAIDPAHINPEELTYKTFTVNHASVGYSKVQGVTGLVDPVFDNEATFSLLYSGALGDPTFIKVNGEEQQASSGGIVKEILTGTLRINPTKLAGEYSVFNVGFENGEELIFVIKKEGGSSEPGESTHSGSGDQDIDDVDLSTLDYTELVCSDDNKYSIAYNMYKGVLGSVNPEFTGHGNSFIMRFNATLKAESVKVNGNTSSAISTNDYGVIIVNPFKLVNNSYSTVVATFEDGSQLICVLRKGDPENATVEESTTRQETTKDPFIGDDFFNEQTMPYSGKYGHYTINVDSNNSYGIIAVQGLDDSNHIKVKNYGATGDYNGTQVVKEFDGLIPNSKYIVKIPVKDEKAGEKIYCTDAGGAITLTGSVQEIECLVVADQDGKAIITIGTGKLGTDNSLEVFKPSIEAKEIVTKKPDPTTTEVVTNAETTTEAVATFPADPTYAPTKAVNIGKAKIKKVVAKKKSAKKLTIKIKKLTGVKGYQVAVFKTKKNAKKAKKALFKKYVKKNVATLKITHKKLKNKATLFVRVRGYLLKDDEVKFGKWSDVKKVKVK